MKTHITNLYGQASSSVAMIAQNMVVDYAREMGFREIGIYSYPVHIDSDGELSARVDGMLAALTVGDVVVVQSPSWNSTEFDDYFVNKLRAYPGVKIVIFVHDIIPLMFKSNEYLIDKTIETYNKADVLILPSEKMEKELRRWGLTTEKIVYQNMWDHPNPHPYQVPPFARHMQFAGAPSRFTFVNEWDFEIPLIYYAFEGPAETAKNVDFRGYRSDMELLKELAQTGGFGLVWSQKSDVDYYEWNVSYKLGTYLAAGIPVIVQDNLSNQEIVQKNNLGFVVSSLEEAQEKIQKMTEEEYRQMVDNVHNYQSLVINGYFSKKVLVDSVHLALEK